MPAIYIGIADDCIEQRRVATKTVCVGEGPVIRGSMKFGMLPISDVKIRKIEILKELAKIF